jgi:chitodextrinase
VDLTVQGDGSLRLGVDGKADSSPAFSSPNKIPVNASLPTDNWVFFAVTYQAFGEAKFYFGNTTTSVSLDIARSYPGPGPVGSNVSMIIIGEGFAGLTDELRVYPAALSLQEMAAIQYGPADTTSPTAPGGLSLTSKTETTVFLHWTTNSTDNIGVIGHALFNGTTLLSKTYPQPKEPPQTTAAIGLTPGTTYMLTLRGFDVKGNYSEPSNVVVVTTDGNAATAPAIDLRLDAGPGSDEYNLGTAPATFNRSAGIPMHSSNIPTGVLGTASADFGTVTGDYFVESTAPIDGLKNLNAFTLTGWVNNRSNVVGPGGNRIISWINNGGDGVDLVYQANGNLRLGVDGWADLSPAFSSIDKIPTNSEAPASNWVFFAVTYQSNGQVQFYFGNNTTDAVLDVVKTYSGPGVTGSNIGKLAIGSYNDATRNPGTYDRMFKGLIDNITVHSKILSPTEIVGVQRSAGADTSPPPAPTSLVAQSVTASSVTFQWQVPQDQSDIASYLITGNTSAGQFTGSSTVTPFNYPGLNANTAYTFFVQSKDRAGNLSEPSNTISVTTLSGPFPLIRLALDETSGVNPVNVGSLSSSFNRSSGIPVSSTLAARGSGSFGFDVNAGNYYVESPGVIDGLKNLSAFTITGWINNRVAVAGSGGNRIVSWINNGGDGVDLVYQSNGSLRLGVDQWPDFSPAVSSTNKVTTLNNPTLQSTNWIFFAVTYKSNGQVEYYFGKLDALATLDATKSYAGRGTTGSNISKLALGNFNSATRNPSTYDRMFRGFIDDIQIFGSALSLDEIIFVQQGSSARQSTSSVARYESETVMSEEGEELTTLFQNYPNPFESETTIDLYIPHAAKVARVIVNDLSGRSLKNIEVMGRGKTSVTIGSGDMNNGMYFYSLLVDGKTQGTKRMAITK